MIMRRVFQNASSTLVHASLAAAMGAVTAACSTDNAPVLTPADASTDQNAKIDEGVPDANACDASLVVFYGPMGCSADQDCVQTNGPGFVCDKSAGITDACGRFTSWPVCTFIDAGIPDALDSSIDQDAVDVAVDGTAVDAASDRESVDASGPVEAAAVDVGVPDANVCDAGLMAFYGPMQCSTDQQCVQEGVGFWCDKSAGFTDPCGRFTSWPLCRPGDADTLDARADGTTPADSGTD
jgi:hypothetical protein